MLFPSQEDRESPYFRDNDENVRQADSSAHGFLPSEENPFIPRHRSPLRGTVPDSSPDGIPLQLS